MTLRLYQNEAIEAINEHLASKTNNPCVVLPTACHEKGHPILMFDGTIKNVEDIRVGELVMGNDSTPRTVLNICHGIDDMFRIVPKRGEPFVVNGNHVLSLMSTNEGKKYRSNTTGNEIYNITVNDYIIKSKSWKHLRKLYRTSVDFNNEKTLPIDPHILGLIIGDGCVLNNTVSYTSADEELISELEKYSESIGCKIGNRKYRNGSCCVSIVCDKKKNHNTMKNRLREVGLMNCDSWSKFIPHNYLTASKDNRMNLFAGLIDTDGYVNYGKGIDYITASERLAEDITFLARSLGFVVKATRKYCKCQTGNGGVYNRLSISGDLTTIPLRRKYHTDRINPRKMKKNVLKTGFDVIPVGKGEYYGFTLDGNHLYVDGRFMVHHNSGKSLVMSETIRRWKEKCPRLRCIVLAHRKELVDQNAKELRGIYPDGDIGIYAAGLGQHDVSHTVTFAGIDSVYNKAGSFPPFDVIIIDEAHRIPVRGEGKYRTFIADCQHFNPNVRVIGFTATPFRLGSGPVCHKDYILNEICYEANVGELVSQGYLCTLRSKVSETTPDLKGVKKSAGDYQQKALGILMGQGELVRRTVTDALRHLDDEGRRCCVWFCVDVAHCEMVMNEMKIHGETARMVVGSTSVSERDATVEAFRSNRFRHLLNVNVFTEGFNVKQVDAVVLLRPTLSRSLYIQMVGRGMRLHPSKTDCLILDYAHCIEEHGPIDAPYDGKVTVEICQNCREVFARGIRVCPKCGWEIPKHVIEERERTEHERKMHEDRVSQLAILGSRPTEYPVSAVMVSRHEKNGIASLCVTYRCGIQTFREWVCLDHEGYARTRAENWWKQRFGDVEVPTVEEALQDMFLGYEIGRRTASITVVRNGKYNEITNHTLIQNELK